MEFFLLGVCEWISQCTFSSFRSYGRFGYESCCWCLYLIASIMNFRSWSKRISASRTFSYRSIDHCVSWLYEYLIIISESYALITAKNLLFSWCCCFLPVELLVEGGVESVWITKETFRDWIGIKSVGIQMCAMYCIMKNVRIIFIITETGFLKLLYIIGNYVNEHWPTSTTATMERRSEGYTKSYESSWRPGVLIYSSVCQKNTGLQLY